MIAPPLLQMAHITDMMMFFKPLKTSLKHEHTKFFTQTIDAIDEFIDAHNHLFLPIIVDPDPDNAVAIRCYEKVGFKKVGTYEMAHGPCLLMRYDY